MRRLPDKIYLIIEGAVDEINKEINIKDFRGPVYHLIEKEFKMKLREGMIPTKTQ